MTEDRILIRGSEVWSLLREAALDDRRWDVDLTEDLRAALGLQPAEDMVEGLDRRDIDADSFIRAFFAVVQPFVLMWEELLAMLASAGAGGGDDALRIDYHFGEGDDQTVSFDLDNFRRARQLLVLERRPFDLGRVARSELFDLIFAFSASSDWPPELAGWLKSYWEWSAAWPAGLPTIEAGAEGGVNGPIIESLALAAWVLQEVSAIAATRNALLETEALPDRSPEGVDSGLLAYMERDMWVGNLVVAAYNAAAGGLSQSQAAAVERELSRYRNHDDDLQSIVERALEFLELPIWQYRHELFSNWVCTRLIAALEDRQPVVHVGVDGHVRFRFSGTHLATFDATRPRLHLFTDLRSRHNNPVGKGRRSAIQPDISLVFDPVTDIATSPLVVECKQYARAAHRSFGEAITDYATGRPDATVVLVDHGRVDDQAVLQFVPAELHHRVHVVSEFRPGHSPALDLLTSVVRHRLDLVAPSGGATAPAPAVIDEAVATISLTWESPPHDLDLHLVIEERDGTDHAIDFQNRGDLAGAPWCQLDADVTTGESPETITVARWLDATYHLSVNQYSSDGELGTSAAQIVVATKELRQTFTCPPETVGRWDVEAFTPNV